MASDKFKGCFIDQQPDYEYPIYWDGEQVAIARTLSVKDKGKIQRLVKKIYDAETGKLIPDPNSDDISTLLGTIEIALVSWESDKPITVENIALLPDEVILSIFNDISKHETKSQEAVEDTEKNL